MRVHRSVVALVAKPRLLTLVSTVYRTRLSASARAVLSAIATFASTAARPRPPQSPLGVLTATTPRRSTHALLVTPSGGSLTEVTTPPRPVARTGWPPTPGTSGPVPSTRVSATHPLRPAHLPFRPPPPLPLLPLLPEIVLVLMVSAVVRAGVALLAANPERHVRCSISGTPSACEHSKTI